MPLRNMCCCCLICTKTVVATDCGARNIALHMRAKSPPAGQAGPMSKIIHHVPRTRYLSQKGLMPVQSLECMYKFPSVFTEES